MPVCMPEYDPERELIEDLKKARTLKDVKDAMKKYIIAKVR